MHRAKRAVIMAAGMGNRMRPVTLEMPKPLVKVRGRRMIDTMIDGLHAQGITEIYVVIGYQKEKFSQLKADYPDITLIENPYYETCNNISSLYVAREHIEDAIIADGDQILYHPEILAPEFDRSCYCCCRTKEHTEEWLLTVEDGIVTKCSRSGGQDGWQLYSVSFWSAEDGRRLKGHLEQEFEKKRHRDIFWDDIALFCYPKEYQLGIRPIKKGDLLEIDDLTELAALDGHYSKYVGKIV